MELEPGDTLRVPLEEIQNKDVSIKARRVIGVMVFVKNTPGKSAYTEWTMTVPTLFGDQSIQIKAKGPEDVNIACEKHGLKGPNVPEWTSVVHVYRDGIDDIGTVKKLKTKARRIWEANRIVREAYCQMEASRENLDKLGEILRIQFERIDREDESAESESEDSENEH